MFDIPFFRHWYFHFKLSVQCKARIKTLPIRVGLRLCETKVKYWLKLTICWVDIYAYPFIYLVSTSHQSLYSYYINTIMHKRAPMKWQCQYGVRAITVASCSMRAGCAVQLVYVYVDTLTRKLFFVTFRLTRHDNFLSFFIATFGVLLPLNTANVQAYTAFIFATPDILLCRVSL